MKDKKSKKKVIYYPDDGRTIYSMDGLSGESTKEKDKKDDVKLTRKEKFAAIRAGFLVYLPKLLLVLGCFSVTMLLLYLWLK